jgi:hypothetical protein
MQTRCRLGARRTHAAGDLFEVGVPRATASAEYIEVRIAASETANQFTERSGVARFQMPERAQRDLVHHRGIWAQRTYPLEPRAGFDGRHELERVRTVDAVKGRPGIPGLGINRFDRILHRWPRVQPTRVVIQREQDRERKSDSRCGTG